MTSKNMESFFNIGVIPTDDESDADQLRDCEFTMADRNRLISEAQGIYTDMEMVDRINIALPVVTDLTEHDKDMDEISTRAMNSFNDLLSLGSNVPDMHAGKIYEVASTMLKTALEAKNAKADRKLRIIDLQLKKARLDIIANPEAAAAGRTGGEFNRSELMKYIVDAASKPVE